MNDELNVQIISNRGYKIDEFLYDIDLLTKTHKKLTEATDTIEDATKKGEKIKKQLSKVDEYEIEGVSNKQLENKD